MKITLIHPPFLFPVEPEITLSHCLGLRYISSYLKTEGSHQVTFIDALNLGFSNIEKYANGYIVGLEIEDIVKQIPHDTDLIGISVPFSQLAPIAHDLVDLAKSRFPNAKIVMGGVYPSTQPREALSSKADLIVVGEGERALLQIASGKDPQGIKGVYSRADTQDEIFSATDLIEDLDTLPLPDDALPNMDQYYNISPRNDRAHRTASIITSRGCPFRCDFCSIHPVYGHRWRGRSAENVLYEIEYLNKKHGINCYEIEDDNFTLQKQRTIDILEGLVRLNEKGCNLMWRTPNGVRIDTIDADIARLIKRSNCKEIVVALEHGDREMLHLMNKKLDPDKAYDVMRMLVEQGIPHITIFVIVGYPGESRERFLKGLAYLKRIKALGGSVSVWVNIAQPYPGTRLLQRCKEAGYLSDPSIDNFLVKRNLMSTKHFVPITTPDFDAQEVLHRKRMIQEVFSPSKGVRSGGEAENLRSYTNPEAEHPVATRTPRKDDSVRILLCGWYFQGNTGDDLSIEPILKTLSKYGEVRVSTTEIFDRDLIGWCDLLVIGSGSHITPRGISSYKQVKYAKESGKKVVFYSQTIEEGHPQFREHLARADLITVRDAESKRVVEANGFRAVLASDPIFKTKRRAIGCSFRRWVNEPPGIVDRFASILDDLALDYDVVLLPFTEVDTDTESDTAFHEQIMYKMKKKPRQAAYGDKIENVDLLIGMRLHALISALNIGKQVLAIDYDTKIRRIFSDLALEDRVVSYDTVDQIPQVVRGKIFRSDGLAMREKVNEALIARICEEIKGEAKPKISVVMPTYNRENYLKEAIDSIEEQTLQDWELIVIDDGSTDDTRGLVESYKDERILYHNFGHNGITFSRNIGSLLSRGEIIAVADSDDINLPNRLEVTYKEMERHGADILYSSMFHFRGTGEKELIPSHPFSDERLKKGNFIYHPTVAYRRKVAMTCPYSEALQMVEDYHMYLQTTEKGYRFHQVEEPLVMHRLHETQISAARSEEMAEIHRRLVHSRGKAVRTKVDQHHPMVSVIVPTYNRPEMLKEALMSILSQTYQDFEIIVVNDAGEDVKEVIDSLNSEGKIIYLQHEENKGLPAARDTGLNAAKGKYIAYLDDDDIYYPNHLETLVGFLEDNDYKAAYSDSYHVFQEWITDRYVTVAKKVLYSQDFDRKKLLISNYFPVINVVHRKDILEEAGLFDETLGAHEDWDLWIRISQQCDFHHIKTVTAEVRVRSDGTTMTSRDRMPFLKTLKTIHARYSHQVTDNRILEEQKKVEESLTREVEILQLSSSVMQYEHLHRYRFAKEYVKGRKVLDLASGEGDGDFMLSEDANEVIGMDTDELVIRRASSNNARENLKFIKGSITDVPIKGEKIFDVIVCFRPPQGIEEWDKLMKEVKRLIIDDGIFVASVPNQYFSLDQSNYQPPTHLRGLSIDEFRGLLNRYFENTILYGQKVYPSSNIFPLFGGIHKTSNYVIEKTEAAFLFTQSERKQALHFISVSSNGPVKDVIGHSYLVDLSETLFKLKDAQIKGLELDLRERDSHIMSLEAAIKDKGAHIENLERQREENYRDWQAHVKNLERTLEDREQHIQNLEAALRDKESHIGNLERQREENYRDWQAHEKHLRTIIEDKQTHIGNLETVVRDKDAHIGSLEAAMRDKDVHIGSLEATVSEKEATLNRIYNSYGLGALLICNKMIDKLFPFNSKRRRYAKTILNTIKHPKNPVKNSNKSSY